MIFCETVLIIKIGTLKYSNIKGVFKGGGVQEVQPPPHQKFTDFFLKSERKEIEINKKGKGCVLRGGGAVYLLTYILRVEIFSREFENFSGGGEGLRNFLGGLNTFFGGEGVEKILGWG